MRFSMTGYNKDNIFAKIIRKEIPCKEVYQDEEVIAFHDIAPEAPVHVLVLPKGEYISFEDFVTKSSSEQTAHFFKKVKEIAQSLGLSESGYRIITNHGKNASQSVPHFHVHILGGKALGKLLR